MTENVPVTQPNGAVALTAEDLALMGASAPTQDFKQEDLLIPYLLIVQATSAYIMRNEPEFIESARPGDILDTLTMETRQKVAFVPVKYEVTYTEWKPNRGGMVKQWGTDASGYDAAQGDYGTHRTAEGNDIVPSATYYGLIVFEDGATMPVTLKMSGAQYKKSRRLNTLINMLELPKPDGSRFNPPIYSRFYALTTVGESNDQGNWFGWKIEPGAMVLQVTGGKAIYTKAAKLREQIEAGTARSAPTTATVQRTMDTDARGDDSIPF
jgi:hypothetical protein